MSNNSLPSDNPITEGQVRERGLRAIHEGEDGVFSQSWFPVCLSSELDSNQLLGRDFLDGRVIVFRGADGKAHVKSGYCPHVGADLSVGRIVDNNVQCAFHHWEYDPTGRCVKTGIGDPPPLGACLFNFPTLEKYGIVWAFNGIEPLWDLPDMDRDNIVTHVFHTDMYQCDPWVFAANTPDMQHIKVVHGIRFRHDDPHTDVNWTDWGFDYRIVAEHGQGPDIDWKIGIKGTSTYMQQGLVDGWWLGVYAGFSLPRPGCHQAYVCIAVERGDDSPEAIHRQDQLLEFGTNLLRNTAEEDRPILDSIHYNPRNLTRGDRTLGRYLVFLRDYPRAHPSRNLIN
ncbi:MAG: Rieske 2Fe-2S domain-containing protein [Haliea sp.]